MKTAILISLLAVLVIPPAVYGQEMTAPVEVQIQLFLKILTFDRSLLEQSEGKIEFAVLYQNKFKLSLNTANEIRKFIGEQRIDNLESVPVEWKFIEVNTAADFSEALSNTQLSAVYIAPIRAVDIKQIVALCRKYNINTFTGVVDYMDFGAAVGIGARINKPEIIINLTAAKAEHSDYSSQLLKLCRIIEDTEKP